MKSTQHNTSGREPERVQPQGTAWTRDWLLQVYHRCLSQDQCANEFGVDWRLHVPEPQRRRKAEGVCMCHRYTQSP